MSQADGVLADRDTTVPGASSPGLLWAAMRREADAALRHDAVLGSLLERAVLRREGLADALAHRLAAKLGDGDLPAEFLVAMVTEALDDRPDLLDAASADLRAIPDRDPACPDHLTPFLFFKGFQALQACRISGWAWGHRRAHLAHALQSRVSEVFGVDIHPAARLGRGILLDHGTGVVIGETAVVEDDVSMLQEVTLGGTGKECGDRHPKIRRGVLIGAGAKVLGNIEVGEGAKIGAGSIVLSDVEAFTTVVGVPARPVGTPNRGALPALTMDQSLPAVDYSI